MSTPTAETSTSKIFWNSVVSTPEEKYMWIEMNCFYLVMTLTRYEYLRIATILIPDEIIHQYNLLPLVRNGYIYLDICKGMYVFTQTWRLSNDILAKWVEPKGCLKLKHTPGLLRHKWRPILLSLVVENFGVKYVGKEHANHLIPAIREFYPVAEDWNGILYWGIKLKWDYQKWTFDSSMPKYVATSLHKYQRKTPHRQ